MVCLSVWLAGCLAGWLAGWLPACLPGCLMPAWLPDHDLAACSPRFRCLSGPSLTIYGCSDADGDAYDSHTETVEQAVAKVLRAGTDNDCGTFVSQHAQSALDKGVITEADLDARLRNLFRVRMRLMHFDPPGALQTIPPSVICSAHA